MSRDKTADEASPDAQFAATDLRETMAMEPEGAKIEAETESVGTVVPDRHEPDSRVADPKTRGGGTL